MHDTVFDPAFEKHLTELAEDERTVIGYYYGIEGRAKLPLQGIAEVLRKPGVSTVEVRQVLVRALQTLRRARDRSGTHRISTKPAAVSEV